MLVTGELGDVYTAQVQLLQLTDEGILTLVLKGPHIRLFGRGGTQLRYCDPDMVVLSSGV